MSGPKPITPGDDEAVQAMESPYRHLPARVPPEGTLAETRDTPRGEDPRGFPEADRTFQSGG